MRKQPVRVGDEVRVVVPKFLVRVGYPKTVEDYLSVVDREIHCVEALMERLVSGPDVRPSLSFFEGGAGKMVRNRIRRDLAYLVAKSDGFGGRERRLHVREVPCYLGAQGVVTELRTAVTGNYRAAYQPRCGYYEDEGEPAHLEDEERHRIARVQLQYSWPGADYLDNPEIEVANLEEIE